MEVAIVFLYCGIYPSEPTSKTRKNVGLESKKGSCEISHLHQ